MCIRDRLMLEGTSIVDPARIDIRGELTCGRDVTIDVGCVFEGTVALDDGVSVGPYCVLRDVSVGAATRVEAFSHFESAVIGRNCRIGPYARLRPGTKLAEDVHIGNFVEVKASTLGDDVHVGSNCVLVAPITIGAGATIGGGSTIVHEAPAGQLTVARAKQVT